MSTTRNTESKVGLSPAAKAAAQSKRKPAAPAKKSASTSSATKRRTPRHVAAKAKAADVAAKAAPTSDQLTELQATLAAALGAPGVITGRLERNRAARDEGKALTAWRKDGEKGKAPATPNADLLNAHLACRNAGVKVDDLPDTTTPRAPRADKATGIAKAATGTSTSAAPKVNTDGTKRLTSGGLGELVEKHMKAHPGEELSPSQVAKALGRSSGAVSNALDRLKVGGVVKRTSDKPRRYAAPKAAAGKAAA